MLAGHLKETVVLYTSEIALGTRHETIFHFCRA